MTRPSYQQVRLIVHHLRREREQVRAAELLVDVAMRLRTPEALADHVAGIEQRRMRPRRR